MSAMPSMDEAPRLVDLLIEEQQTLRAVDEFSALHDSGELDVARFETLIPLEAPGEGQQFAFSVDLDGCTGCKACVTACHSLNGLEIGETWRKVGVIESGGGQESLPTHQQSVTTACHHCADPGCLSGCPVRAYEKDPVTGVVVHLDDQCIGCRYCQLMCPYDVPQFSERLGIVRKCDMCHGRLSEGEAPACVQGCPNEAISIRIVDVPAEPPEMLLPVVAGEMPASAITRPTTEYRTAREAALDLRPVDEGPLAASHGHSPLAVMLVLTQASVGTLLFDRVFAGLAPGAWGPGPQLASLALAAGLGFLGLGASLLHIGRPQWAFRVFLGVGTSWLSREILVFGAFAGALLAALGTSAVAAFGELSGSPLLATLASLEAPARLAALGAGVLGIFCSIQLYAVTGRPYWRFDRTVLRFGATSLVLGAAATSLAWNAESMLASRPVGEAMGWASALPVAVGLLVWGKLRLEGARLLRGAGAFDEAALARTRALFAGALASIVRLRRGVALALGIGLPLLHLAVALAGASAAVLAGLAAICLLGCLAGEMLERSLFFRGEAMRAMPGSS